MDGTSNQNKKFQNEKEKHWAILEEYPDAVIAINQYGSIEFVNKLAEAISGYDRNEIMKKNITMLMPETYVAHHDGYLSRYMETRIPHIIGFGRQVELLTKSKVIIPIFLMVTQMIFEEEHIFIAFIKDYREQQKNEAEARQLSLIAKKTKSGIIISDKDRKIEWANAGFLKMSGFSMEELIGKNPGNLLQGKDSNKETILRMRQKLNAGEPVVEEILNYRKNHETYWAKMYIEPVTDASGNVENFIATEFDITSEREMRMAIEQANEKARHWNTHYKALVDAIPDLMFIFDSRGTYLELHSTEESRKDLLDSPENLTGKNIFDILPEATARLLYEHILEAIRTQKSQTLYYTLEMTSGRQYYHARIAPLQGGDRVLAIVLNITEQKKVEMQILTSEARLNDTQQIARVGSWEIEIATNQVYWSKETYNIFGITDMNTPPEKTEFLQTVHSDDRQAVCGALDSIVREGIEHSVELRNILPDGSVKYILARGVPVFEGGILTKVRGTVFDITERKENEETLRIAKEKAEVSAKAKELFLANTSHEIRTPMNAIVGIIELLSKTKLTDSQLEYLDIIEKSTGNLLNIINDILDISKIESNKLQIEKSSFLMRSIVDSIIDTNKIKANEKGIELRLQFLPGDDAYALIGDSLRIGQVLQNLISNAVKFTPKGWVELSLSLLSQTDKIIKIKFEVKDTGIGINPEKLQAIFDEFSQADTSTTRIYGGTGLGLSISKWLVELMGGELKVNSIPDIGSSFYFELELEKDLAPQTGKTPVGEAKQGEKDLSGISVLLVEDQEFNQFVAKRFLEGMHAKVDIASNGKVAIEKLTENDFDVVLMDIQMPVMDGVEATYFIRQHMPAPKSGVPVIALTAHALKGDDKKYMSAGMDGYLSKPFSSDNLYSAISKVLKGDKPEQQPDSPEPEEVIVPVDIDNGNTNKLYDLSTFRSMSAGEPGFMETITSTFIDETGKYLQRIRLHIASSDYAVIKASAHAIKPSFKMIGRTDIFDELEQIEKFAEKEKGMDSISLLVHQIEEAFDLIRTELSKEYPA